MVNTSTLDWFYKSTAIVIDDNLGIKEADTINTIIPLLEKRGTQFVKYNKLPDKTIISSISKINYIILDWDFKNKHIESNKDLEISQDDYQTAIGQGASALETSENDDNCEFLKGVLDKYLIPVLIVTDKHEGIISAAINKQVDMTYFYKNNLIHYIYKSSFPKEENIDEFFINLFKKNPSIYLTLKWSESVNYSYHKLAKTLFKSKGSWANLFYSGYIEYDDNEKSRKLLDTMSVIANGYLESCGFDLSYFTNDITEFTIHDKVTVYSAIKLYHYNDQIRTRPNTGDLYCHTDESLNIKYYLLNVTASCNFRTGKMIVIEGRSKYPEEEPDDNMNSGINKFFNSPSKYKLVYVDDNEYVLFDFKYHHYNIPFDSNMNKITLKDYMVAKWIEDERKKYCTHCENKKNSDSNNEREYKLIGRIISPFIDSIQRGYSDYISRIGLPEQK